MDESIPSVEEKFVDAEAIKAWEFYAQNYTRLVYAELGSNGKHTVLRAKSFKCRVCDGVPPEKTFNNDAHAVSESLGNKHILSRDECDDCGERFSKFEDDLAKMTMPARSIGMVRGKNGVPTLISSPSGEAREARIECNDGQLEILHIAGDCSVGEDELAKTITFSYSQRPYRPLGAYKALCKSAFALLPHDELVHFKDLRQWLLQEDLQSDQVYADGCHICYTTFVPGFRPFPGTIVALHRRKYQTEAFYMSFFIAFGNVSYQIFLPCPAMDNHLRGKTISMLPLPHVFQLQPRLVPFPTKSGLIELSSPERTNKRKGTVVCK
jgi:hypothetical protein